MEIKWRGDDFAWSVGRDRRSDSLVESPQGVDSFQHVAVFLDSALAEQGGPGVHGARRLCPRVAGSVNSSPLAVVYLMEGRLSGARTAQRLRALRHSVGAECPEPSSFDLCRRPGNGTGDLPHPTAQ